jgi:hypothetical protein
LKISGFEGIKMQQMQRNRIERKMKLERYKKSEKKIKQGANKRFFVCLFCFGYCFNPQTPKHIGGGWSHYTDTSEPVDGNGAQNYGHCPIRVSNQGPFDHWPSALNQQAYGGAEEKNHHHKSYTPSLTTNQQVRREDKQRKRTFKIQRRTIRTIRTIRDQSRVIHQTKRV